MAPTRRPDTNPDGAAARGRRPLLKPSVVAEGVFAQYCAMGVEGVGRQARSLRRLAEQNSTKGTPAHIRTLARRYQMWNERDNWQARVIEYDRQKAEEKRARREMELAKMEDRHALMAQDVLHKAYKRIVALAEKGDLGAQTAVALFAEASKMERMARTGAAGREDSDNKQTVNVGVAVGFYSPVQLPAKTVLEPTPPALPDTNTVEGSVKVLEEPTHTDAGK